MCKDIIGLFERPKNNEKKNEIDKAKNYETRWNTMQLLKRTRQLCMY